MPPPDLFRVEEFVNYHRHDLPLPDEDQRIRLDVQQMSLGSGKKLVQLGITTPRALDTETMQPLNIVLVIDDSGSMRGEKMEQLKESLHAIIARFRESDRVTIVGFDNRSRLVLPATKKTNHRKIRDAINSITADGGTDLHAGLMMGFREAQKNFDAERINRVIFLTDGNANVGETHADEIAAESKSCIEKGISLVTIGLGVDFNNGLLRQIADSGHGPMHFIGDAKDIRKTFVKEIDSLLAPAASKVRLKIELKKTRGVNVFGYEKNLKQVGDKLIFKLDDLNCGATQVVLAKVSADELAGEAKLKYVDAITGKKVELVVDLANVDAEPSRSLRRNYAISQVAWGIKSAAKRCQEHEPEEAVRKLESSLKRAEGFCDAEEDRHLRRVEKIARGYLKKLRPKLAEYRRHDLSWED